MRRPAFVAAGTATLVALLLTNGVAFFRGLDSPWLLGTVIIADMLAIGVGVLFAAREVLVAEHRQEEREAQLGAIVDSAMDAIITVDATQTVRLFNRAAEQVFRCRREQAIGSPLERFLPQRFRAVHRSHVEDFGKTGVTSRRMGDVTTLWALRADGEEFPIEASISQVSAEGERYFTVILRDITLRKQAEDALLRQQQELRDLSAQVLEAREEEKTRIARELHDELGQLLTAVRMDLAWLAERARGEDPEVQAKLREVNAMVDQTVAATRRISADLRPLMLDDLGLADAAAWLVEEFAKRSSVHCSFQSGDAAALENVPKAIATAVYRALQESLTNIARHSQAKNAWILLTAEENEMRFEVEDDGRGIAAADLAKVRSLGLKGMRERLAYLGGSLDIGPAPRGGTRLRGRLPLRVEVAEDRA